MPGAPPQELASDSASRIAGLGVVVPKIRPCFSGRGGQPGNLSRFLGLDFEPANAAPVVFDKGRLVIWHVLVLVAILHFVDLIAWVTLPPCHHVPVLLFLSLLVL